MAVAAHLTCVGSSVDELRAFLAEAARRGPASFFTAPIGKAQRALHFRKGLRTIESFKPRNHQFAMSDSVGKPGMALSPGNIGI
jgi:hypothetical protein